MISDQPSAISHQPSASRPRLSHRRALARALAANIARALAADAATVLGLPTGRTPIPLYRELVRLHRAGRADFSRATTFNLDEFLGLDAARSAQLPRLHAAASVRPRQPGAAADPFPERRDARRRRADAGATSAPSTRAGGIDLQILGLGMNGHIGFNEPARGADRAHPLHAADAGDAPRQRRAFRQPRQRGAARSAVDGDGDDSSRAPDRAARDRRDEGAMRGADDRGTGDAAAAGVVSAAAPLRRDLAGSQPPRRKLGIYPTLQQFLQPRFDVLADRVADDVVGAAQARQRLRVGELALLHDDRRLDVPVRACAAACRRRRSRGR